MQAEQPTTVIQAQRVLRRPVLVAAPAVVTRISTTTFPSRPHGQAQACCCIPHLHALPFRIPGDVG